jgi:nicotinate-nucleotide adenylyltransferase
MQTDDIQEIVRTTYEDVFGRTPLRQRLSDIMGEAVELSRYVDLPNLREETGDLLGSTIQLINECGWSIDDLIKENLAKIERRRPQYRALGRKIKVAILGGAFDPIHEGHIQVAKFVLNTSREFDEVWMMPCFSHLYNKKMESAEHRLAMCKLAAKVDGRIRVSDYEVKKELTGETYHLLKLLMGEDFAKTRYDFSWIVGIDNANTFDKWVNYQDLERMVRFVVVPRKGVDPTAEWFLKPPHLYLTSEHHRPMEVSSTEIRLDLYKADVSFDGRLNSDVLDYIKQNNLYQPNL